jgi:hypothetical protein
MNKKAYISTGLMPMLMQFVITVIVSIGVFVKIYWNKIKSWVKRTN